MTGRCLQYAQEQAIVAERPALSAGERDINNAAFWESLADTFRDVREMIQQDLKDRGLTVTPEAERAARVSEARHRRREHRRREHPLNKAAFAYIKTVQAWFKTNQGLFKDKAEELTGAASMELPGVDPVAEARDVTDAADVIQWYHMQIAVKIERAFSSRDRGDEDDDFGGDDPELTAALEESSTTDTNGSAKVALIGIERSLAAWARIRNHFPDQGDALLDVLVSLDRLRRGLEAEFPDARVFKRPGFDD